MSTHFKNTLIYTLMQKTFYRVIVTNGDPELIDPITKWPNCYGPYHVFKSVDSLHEFMDIFAWGMGIKEWDYEEVTFNEDELRFLNFLAWDFKNDSITEYCPDCETEVELKYTFSVQVCPHCGELIIPCALCDHDRCDCANCPLEAIKQDILRNYTKNVQ